MKIIKVKKGSIGDSLGLKPGDRLLKINSAKVKDEIDYRFKISEEELTIELEINGKRKIFEIEKDFDDSLGVELEEFKIRSCANDCIFCFVDQNPAGMRKGMYFRDGDFRLSYLHGHYVTMTNMGPKELGRIVEQRLSPLYISVHATGVELRKRLLLYGKDDKLLDKIKFLTDNGIELHAQIVLMPGINDGANLIQTIEDLHAFYPKLNSLTIVPVGLTKHREGLPDIKTVTPEYSKVMLGQADELNEKFRIDIQRSFIFFSDEWYILANKKLPHLDEYGSLDLMENGVGQVASFINQLNEEKKHFPKSLDHYREFSIVTGTLMEGIFKEHIMPLLDNIHNLKVNLYIIKNDFYGDVVTVTGLLAGRDIINQLKGKQLGEAVWTSYRILNDEGTLTLDDMTTQMISNQIGRPFNITQDSILEIFNRDIHG
tara:strand:- start:3167 stop:4456 length:1290 start_codon:yes stop_codon:yes gene_type:complete